MTGPRMKVADQERVAWTAACQLKSFTVYGLSAQTGVRVDVLKKAVPTWARDGRIEVVGHRGLRRKLWRAVRGKAMPKPSADPAQNMWRTMRHLNSFTPIDVQMHSNTDDARVAAEDAQAFCRQLLRAGYLRVLRKAKPGVAPAMYALVRNTGPIAPVERRVRAIWDPNTKSYAYVPEPDQ